MVEQDHRRIQHHIGPMLGFKQLDNAAVTTSGIELAEKIKKGQFRTGRLGGRLARRQLGAQSAHRHRYLGAHLTGHRQDHRDCVAGGDTGRNHGIDLVKPGETRGQAGKKDLR